MFIFSEEFHSLIAIKALVWRVHETEFFLQRRDGARQFSSLEVREAATAPGIFFRKPFPADCMFCFLFVFGFFFFFGGGGIKAPNWRVCD